MQHMSLTSRQFGNKLEQSTRSEKRFRQRFDPTCEVKQGAEALIVKGTVSVLTEGLRLAGVGKLSAQQPAKSTPKRLQLLRPGDVDGLLRIIRRDFEKNQYFVTGVLSENIYDEYCEFADPTVSFSGRELWKRNIQLLVPFLLEPKIQLRSLYSLQPRKPFFLWNTPRDSDSGPVQLYSEWLLTCYIGLPWRPYVELNGSTNFTLNATGNQIVRHVEAWEISPVQAILLLFKPSDRAVWKLRSKG